MVRFVGFVCIASASLLACSSESTNPSGSGSGGGTATGGSWATGGGGKGGSAPTGGSGGSSGASGGSAGSGGTSGGGGGSAGSTAGGGSAGACGGASGGPGVCSTPASLLKNGGFELGFTGNFPTNWISFGSSTTTVTANQGNPESCKGIQINAVQANGIQQVVPMTALPETKTAVLRCDVLLPEAGKAANLEVIANGAGGASKVAAATSTTWQTTTVSTSAPQGSTSLTVILKMSTANSARFDNCELALQ